MINYNIAQQKKCIMRIGLLFFERDQRPLCNRKFQRICIIADYELHLYWAWTVYKQPAPSSMSEYISHFPNVDKSSNESMRYGVYILQSKMSQVSFKSLTFSTSLRILNKKMVTNFLVVQSIQTFFCSRWPKIIRYCLFVAKML